MSWPYTKKGEFTVRSAYNYELQRRNRDSGPSDSSASQWLWKKIWEAKVPPKVKNLVWRALRNGLPTMNTLASRGINVDRVCPRCGERVRLPHMILLCKEAQVFSRLSLIRLEVREWELEFVDWGDMFSKT